MLSATKEGISSLGPCSPVKCPQGQSRKFQVFKVGLVDSQIHYEHTITHKYITTIFALDSYHLEQRCVNYSSWAKSSASSYFLKIVLLEHNHFHISHYNGRVE